MRHFSSLLYFNLKAIRPYIWFICLFNIACAAFWTSSGYSSFKMTLAGYPTPFFSLMLGVMFFTEGRILTPIPHREFLFSRPAPRGNAWLARTCLYFALIFAAPVICLCLALRNPDLNIYLYQGDYQQVAGGKLAAYQAAFPGSSIMHPYDIPRGTLDIPRGRLFLACWLLSITALAAQVAQILSLLSPQAQKKMAFVIFGALMLVVPYSWWKETSVEPVFFQFARHWCSFALAAIAATFAFQRFACKRAVKMEAV